MHECCVLTMRQTWTCPKTNKNSPLKRRSISKEYFIIKSTLSLTLKLILNTLAAEAVSQCFAIPGVLTHPPFIILVQRSSTGTTRLEVSHWYSNSKHGRESKVWLHPAEQSLSYVLIKRERVKLGKSVCPEEKRRKNWEMSKKNEK